MEALGVLLAVQETRQEGVEGRVEVVVVGDLRRRMMMISPVF